MIHNNHYTQDAYDCNGVIPYLPTPSLSRSRRVQQRQQYQSHCRVAMANEAISALNHLATSFIGTSDHISPFTNRPVIRAPTMPSVKPLPHSSSQRVQQRVYTAAMRYCRHLQQHHHISTNNTAVRGDRHDQLLSSAPDSPFISSSLLSEIDHLYQQSSMNSSYTSAPPAKLITAANVSLPKVAGTAQLVDIIHPSLAAMYLDPTQLQLPPQQVKKARRAFLCSPSEYRLLLQRMHAGGMLSYTTTPVCVNGLFGVAKDGDAIRLIIDCRPVNALLVPSPHVALPTPDIITKFHVPQHQTLYAAKVIYRIIIIALRCLQHGTHGSHCHHLWRVTLVMVLVIAQIQWYIHALLHCQWASPMRYIWRKRRTNT